MRIWALVVVCAACTSNTNNYPVGGNGGDGGVTVDAKKLMDAPTGMDARDGAVAAVDAAKVNGRVCLLADPHKLTSCASTGAGGLTVRLGAQVPVTTNDDGTFTIDFEAGSWRVTGPNIVTSIRLFSDYQIPAISTATFNAMKTANGVAILPGQGSIIAHIVQNGTGYAGVGVSTTPMNATYDPFYDTATPGTWTQTGAGPNGVAWIAGLDVGMAPDSVKAQPPGLGAQAITSAPQPVVDGAITFVDIVFQ